METAIAPVAAPELWRTCATCGLPRDIKLFSPQGRVCKPCDNTRRNGQRPTLQEMRIQAAVAEVTEKLANQQTTAPSLDAFLTGVLTEFGGLGKFIRKVVEDHEECRHAEKPSRKVIQEFNLSIIRLIRDLDAMRGESSMRKVSEEDLNRILFTAFAEHVEEMTVEQLTAAASLKGYRLVKVEEPEIKEPEIKALPDGNAQQPE